MKSAFPTPVNIPYKDYEGVIYEETNDPGMLLLDYFAAKAMSSLILDDFSTLIEDIVELSYDIAEAMIKEREKRLKK